MPGAWTRSEKAARRAERQLLDRRNRGALAATRGQTLRSYLQGAYLPAVRRVSSRGRPLAPTTDAKYRGHSALVEGSIGDVRLAELRSRHVEHLRDELLGRGLARQTLADVIRFLSQALRRTAGKSLIGQNWAAPL